MNNYKTLFLTTALVLTLNGPFFVGLAEANSSVVVKRTTDAVITAKIKALYAKSSLIKASDIQVNTINQQVYLNGQVKTNSQYERAIILADSVPGVKNIDANHLYIKTSENPVIDSYTTAKVKSVFLKEKLFGKNDIDLWPVKVETTDSIVYLTGKARSNKQKAALIRLAQGVCGVSEVRSLIRVQNS